MFNSKKSYIEINEKINSFFDSLVKGDISLKDFELFLKECKSEIETKGPFSKKHAADLSKRLLDFYEIFIEAKKMPEDIGLRFFSAVVNNRKSKNIGYIFYKEAIPSIKEYVPWAKDFLEETKIIFEDKQFIILSFKEERLISNLGLLSSLTIDLDSYKVIFERKEEDYITRRFFSYFVMKERMKEAV